MKVLAGRARLPPSRKRHSRVINSCGSAGASPSPNARMWCGPFDKSDFRSTRMTPSRTQFVICVSNENCEDLVLGMVYRVIEDEEASQEGLFCLARKNHDCVPSPTPDLAMPYENLDHRLMAEPSRAEIVEFIRLGLQCNLLSIDAIQSWADSVIEMEDSPPNWSIDLAMAGPEDLHDIVRHIPLDISTDRPMELLLGYCADLWQRRDITLERIVSVWRRVYFDEHASLLRKGSHLDAYFESFVDRSISRREMESLVDQAFQPFFRHVNDLPTCLRPA